MITVDQDKEFVWNSWLSYCFEFAHCCPSSFDNSGGKCIASPMTSNCCWNCYFSNSFEIVHCHRSSVDNLGCECMLMQLIWELRIRTSNSCWNGFVSYWFDVVHCGLSLIDPLACKILIRTRNCYWNRCLSNLLNLPNATVFPWMIRV